MHKNITGYREEDYLQISGLQHFRFCRRQWALIHIEKLWAENYRTVDGELMHEHVHDAEFNESRGDVIIRRGVYVHSAELGISGQCDALEFHKGSIGVPMRGKEGLWQPAVSRGIQARRIQDGHGGHIAALRAGYVP